ncbi:MAG: GTPase Era [Gammaproteobacteria bacterium]|nr:GTPase Era [Gammaproteobacteria bacterium]
MSAADFRCGFVAVVGRTNVGKSTLINALVGSKVSIVTAKPQTTRHRILAVLTTDQAQIVFVDTPGIHRNSGKAMNRIMNRTAANALADADLVLFVIEAKRWTEEDADVLEKIKSSGIPAVALLNKVDAVHPKDAILGALSSLAEKHQFEEMIPISAKKGDNLEALLGVIPAYLPESLPLFPEHMRTDRSKEFQAAEIIREKLTHMLHQELPYGLTVQVERYLANDRTFEIDAIIWVERDSQKGIVVGKAGSRLKAIGKAARLELKEQLRGPVHLELWVKVKQNWADNEKDLQALGIDPIV